MFEKGDIMETIRNVDVNRLHDFKNHPFKVEMNTELCELMRSIEKEGVLVPLLVRTNPYGDGYEVISGHRRKEAAIWAGETKVPVVIRELDDDQAVDIYVTLALLRVVNNNISSQYLLKIIASDTIQDYFKSSLKGIGVPNLHLEHIRTTLIPIPPINEQNKIAERIYQYYSLLDSIVQNIE